MKNQAKKHKKIIFVVHCPTGTKTRLTLALPLVPISIVKYLARVLHRRNYKVSIRYNRININQIECVQDQLTIKRLAFFMSQYDAVQAWDSERLPIIVRFNKHRIIWNGHHRVFASILLSKPLCYREYRIK